MKRALITIVLLALIALLPPAALLAQGELTLERLAERVDALLNRVEKMEALWEGPGAEQVNETTCSIGKRFRLQDETVLRHKEQFDEWVAIDQVVPIEIQYSSPTGHTVIIFADSYGGRTSRHVAETWEGCAFVGASDW